MGRPRARACAPLARHTWPAPGGPVGRALALPPTGTPGDPGAWPGAPPQSPRPAPPHSHPGAGPPSAGRSFATGRGRWGQGHRGPAQDTPPALAPPSGAELRQTSLRPSRARAESQRMESRAQLACRKQATPPAHVKRKVPPTADKYPVESHLARKATPPWREGREGFRPSVTRGGTCGVAPPRRRERSVLSSSMPACFCAL
jgi:hypothetical protein